MLSIAADKVLYAVVKPRAFDVKVEVEEGLSKLGYSCGEFELRRLSARERS